MVKETLSLYRSILRAGNQFASFNFRDYVKHRASEAFRANLKLKTQQEIDQAYSYGQEQLALIKRASMMNSLFKLDQTVVEKKR